MSIETRTVRLGPRRVPLILPSRRDPRLHTASVIISIHIIGMIALGFEVSVPQILAAIVTAGLVDVTITLRQTDKLVWPASGMLTGSGVALIMRLVGMSPGDYWSWKGWHWFALVAGLSVLTKYVVRYRGSHIFNPSNVGLVLAFLILGSDLVEPLDFWWAPLGPWMMFAYLVIVVGGILITRRLALLEMAIVFWVALALGLGILSASGHCMVATWAPKPVCDGRFWATVVTSPEVLVFLLFMLTDPKTVPRARVARVVFAAAVGLVATLLIAPNSTEYGAKVGLLASLAMMSPVRGLFDRVFATAGDGRSGLGWIGRRVAAAAPASNFRRGLAIGSSLVVFSAAVFLAGGAARQPAVAASTDTQVEIDLDVNLSGWPAVEVDPSVRRLDVTVDEPFLDRLTLTLAENLAIEAEAMRTVDGSLLGISDGGERLDSMQAGLDTAIATASRVGDVYRFDHLSLRLHEAGEGQTSAGLVFTGSGRVDHVHYDLEGQEVSRDTEDFHLDFVLRQLAGERWVLVLVGPPES